MTHASLSVQLDYTDEDEFLFESWYSLMSAFSFSRIICLAKDFKVLPPISSKIYPIEHLWIVLDKQRKASFSGLKGFVANVLVLDTRTCHQGPVTSASALMTSLSRRPSLHAPIRHTPSEVLCSPWRYKEDLQVGADGSLAVKAL